VTTGSNYFVINETVRLDPRQIRISGDLILKGEVRQEATIDLAEGQALDKSRVPQTAIWVLPPRHSEFYSQIKQLAERSGYRTVEHGDYR
jgi:hypothetical protein